MSELTCTTTVRRRVVVGLLGLLLIASAGDALAQPPSFVEFESGPVRPLALTPDGATSWSNTPDNRLELFSVGPGGLTHTASVPVGMEPVAVAARTTTEAWVVNHLSDSVSIVDVAATPPRVVRTLLVGDEPRDIVFAGPGGTRAFITTAHRGQQRTDPSIAGVPGAGDPQLTTAGVGRADVWVFDAASLGTALGGTPLRIVTLFTDTPRALAVSADGNTVYAAGFDSGNQTTTRRRGRRLRRLRGAAPCAGDGITSPGGLAGGVLPGGNPGPGTNVGSIGAPEVGLIVKFDRGHRRVGGRARPQLEQRRPLQPARQGRLRDRRQHADARSRRTRASARRSSTWSVNPVDRRRLYVCNTESRNETRFEGPGIFGGSTVQGHLAEAAHHGAGQPEHDRPDGANVKPRHLNKHIDYTMLAGDPGFDPTAKRTASRRRSTSSSTPTARRSTSRPSARARSASSTRATLENDTFDPDAWRAPTTSR